MDVVSVVIDLPEVIKRELARLCCGIPHVHWIEEEDLHITIRSLGPLPPPLFLSVKETLRDLEFPSFSLSLQGIKNRVSKRLRGSRRGSIWVEVKPDPALHRLKKRFHAALEDLELPADKSLSIPYVSLGYSTQLSPHHLANFLALHENFCSPTFPVTSFSLYTTKKTAKRVYFQEEERYALT